MKYFGENMWFTRPNLHHGASDREPRYVVAIHAWWEGVDPYGKPGIKVLPLQFPAARAVGRAYLEERHGLNVGDQDLAACLRAMNLPGSTDAKD